MTRAGFTVFVVDDEESVRTSLARLIRSAGFGVEVFGAADAFLKRLPIDGIGCMVLDVSMKGTSGPELHAQLRQRGIFLPVIFLTGHGDVPTSVREMKKGAMDFLLKPADDETLLKTIAAALDQYERADARRSERENIGSRLSQLTQREREVLECILGGYLNKQTAGMLGIVEKTVKVHRGRIMKKMGVRSAAELAYQCEIAGVQPRERREARSPGSLES